MAIPTLSSVTPSSVWTGGQLVTLTGTNFRVGVVPAAYSPTPLAAPKPTVEVTINGEVCEEVYVYSVTEIACRTPRMDPGTASVTVKNLDDSGNPIVGEAVTVSSAFTFVRPDLTAESDTTRVTRQLLIELRRQVIDNVLQYVSVDFGDGATNVTALAALPAIAVSGPTIEEASSTPLELNDPIFVGEYPSPAFDRKRSACLVDMTYRLTGMTDSTVQSHNLQALLWQFFDRNTSIRILRDPADASKGYIKYEMRVPFGNQLRDSTAPNQNNLRSFDIECVVYGVHLEEIVGLTRENLSYQGGIVDTVSLGTVKL